jgi:hypothetical protein
MWECAVSLLTLGSTAILGSKSHGIQDHIILSDGSGRLQSPLAFSSSFFMALFNITWSLRVWKGQFSHPNSHSTWSSALPSRERRQPWGVVLLQALRRKAEAVGWQIELMHLPLCSSVCVWVSLGESGKLTVLLLLLLLPRCPSPVNYPPELTGPYLSLTSAPSVRHSPPMLPT